MIKELFLKLKVYIFQNLLTSKFLKIMRYNQILVSFKKLIFSNDQRINSFLLIHFKNYF